MEGVKRLESLLQEWSLGDVSAVQTGCGTIKKTWQRYKFRQYPPVVYVLLCKIYSDLCRYGTAETVVEQARELCEKCGLTVEPEGIGWVVRP